MKGGQNTMPFPMLRANLVWISLIAILSVSQECFARKCEPSSCGSIGNISYPFRLKGQPHGCGHPDYEVVCDPLNNTILVYQEITFYVKEIDYDGQTIRVVDKNMINDKCSAFGTPPYSLIIYNSLVLYQYQNKFVYDAETVYYLKCARPLNNSKIYLDISICTNTSTQYSYAYVGDANDDDFPESCLIEAQFPFHKYKNFTNDFLSDIYNDMIRGFQLRFWPDFLQNKVSVLRRFKDIWTWFKPFVYTFIHSGLETSFSNRLENGIGALTDDQQHAAYILASYITIRILFGYLFLLSIMVYKCSRKHFSIDDTLEEFIRSQNNFMPIRYKYSHIKTMTHGFKDKLGQGGFGSVFKGKLRSGHLVAVKVLANTKAKGQDFISEVATIGRIHHVNVVRLVGYCIEGSKQALVYDFMPNGSLDGVIFSKETNINLSWQKTYEIVVGVAKGIDYLHKGCDMQILHFDIKPHNILLDKKFTPKLSDFGLARLYPTDVSIVHLTAVQGTRGYIAPELFYKNIGGVSNKADVYSFGMLLIEMVSGRKNLNPRAEQSSQVYFPAWIYERFEQGEEMEFEECTEEDEKKMVKKMVVVAFWCIQMRPVDRPSMSKVLEMLEGEMELIEMPPKPFTQPPETIKEEIITVLSDDNTTITPR